MKRKVILTLCCVLLVGGLTACNADDVNGAIEGAAGKVGIEVDSKLTPDQIDSVVDKAKQSADTTKEVATDEEVQGAVKGLIDSVTDAVRDASDSSSENV